LGCEAQAVSSSASSGKAGFIFIGSPFVDRPLLGGDSVGVCLVGGPGLLGGGAVIGDGAGERSLFLMVELLEARALLLLVASLAFLNDEQQSEGEADGDPSDTLHIEEAQDHWPSASMLAPSRFALSFTRPTGPPARRDHHDHRDDESAQRPAEDGDDRMLLGAAPAAPHEERDHEAGSGAAKQAGGGREQSVDVALSLGEALG
jgi:hypothetical protein